MREIKFRVWVNNRMVYLPYLAFTDCDNLVFSEQKLGHYIDEYIVKTPIILMQFTGLLDKNSKEIYEGDVVKHKTIGCHTGSVLTEDSDGVVVWSGSGFKYQKTEDMGRYNFNFGSELICSEHYEVIGNIYENGTK